MARKKEQGEILGYLGMYPVRQQEEILWHMCNCDHFLNKMEVTFYECLHFYGSHLTSSFQLLSYTTSIEGSSLYFFKPIAIKRIDLRFKLRQRTSRRKEL